MLLAHKLYTIGIYVSSVYITRKRIDVRCTLIERICALDIVYGCRVLC
jgi:hypothetical protein